MEGKPDKNKKILHCKTNTSTISSTFTPLLQNYHILKQLPPCRTTEKRSLKDDHYNYRCLWFNN